jgi:DNA-binding transcriptional regulator YiaG
MTPDEIRAYRKAHNITQEDLAFRLGVTARTIRYWESGHTPIQEQARRILILWPKPRQQRRT